MTTAGSGRSKNPAAGGDNVSVPTGGGVRTGGPIGEATSCMAGPRRNGPVILATVERNRPETTTIPAGAELQTHAHTTFVFIPRPPARHRKRARAYGAWRKVDSRTAVSVIAGRKPPSG